MIDTEANKKMEIYVNGANSAMEGSFSDFLTKLNKAPSENGGKTKAGHLMNVAEVKTAHLKDIEDMDKAHTEHEEKTNAEHPKIT